MDGSSYAGSDTKLEEVKASKGSAEVLDRFVLLLSDRHQHHVVIKKLFPQQEENIMMMMHTAIQSDTNNPLNASFNSGIQMVVV